jgi:hypothetical protein
MLKTLLLIFLAVTLVYSAEKPYAKPVRESVKVFSEPNLQDFVFYATENDRLQIIGTKDNLYKIKNQNGEIGWVSRDSIALFSKSKTIVFEKADVQGYLDNPTPVYIIDSDDPNADPINLTRSFKDALKENVDKETIERLLDKK